MYLLTIIPLKILHQSLKHRPLQARVISTASTHLSHLQSNRPYLTCQCYTSASPWGPSNLSVDAVLLKYQLLDILMDFIVSTRSSRLQSSTPYPTFDLGLERDHKSELIPRTWLGWSSTTSYSSWLLAATMKEWRAEAFFLIPSYNSIIRYLWTDQERELCETNWLYHQWYNFIRLGDTGKSETTLKYMMEGGLDK